MRQALYQCPNDNKKHAVTLHGDSSVVEPHHTCRFCFGEMNLLEVRDVINLQGPRPIPDSQTF